MLASFYLVIYFHNKKHIVNIHQLSHVHYALVLGAGLKKNGRPSDILMDRVLSAIELFQAGKVDYLIMSGAAREGKDETAAMAAAALDRGIPREAILLDRHGISTFESCLNYLQEYAPEKLVIVTQAFHLPRAIQLQRLLGIEACGYAAHIYRFSFYKVAYWYLREVLAMPFNLLKFVNYLFRK